jgi:hypothetical protein
MIYGVLFVVLVVCIFLLLLPLARMSDENLQDGNNPFGGSLSQESWLNKYYQSWLATYEGTPLGGNTWWLWIVLALAIYLYGKHGN